VVTAISIQLERQGRRPEIGDEQASYICLACSATSPVHATASRAGLRVGTAITEGTANVLVNRRMNKSQQMRWARRGADLLLQVRCAVYNGTLGSGFGQKFHPANDPCPPILLKRPSPASKRCFSPDTEQIEH